MKTKRVSIVEDDIWLAGQMQRILKRHDIDSQHTTSASQALDAIDDFKPDIILLDMLLAGTNAMTLLHELQSHTDLAKIPVILVTSLADSLDESDLKIYGVVAMLDKTTMQPDDIITTIKRVGE